MRILTCSLAVLAHGIAPAPFPLTVDSIMRGPDLVGYPPDNLRWSADSQKLYFDWRRPGEDEASSYVVGREGGAPLKLAEYPVENHGFERASSWADEYKRILELFEGNLRQPKSNKTS